ncbi:MAG: hypothetical protein FJW36_21660 [Acidobacteria bacterium]|nr:hypothetical protein [Acidobacteriota bacterium]
MRIPIQALAKPVQAATPNPVSKANDLNGALEEFESLFASTLLRTAREASGGGWLGSESSAGSDGIMDFAEQHIAKAMAQQGAFGIAKTLKHALAQKDAVARQGSLK